MAHLKLLVFGPPRLERDNRPIDLNLRKATALLVYLAVTKRSHSRDALATLLWPDANQREGRARLRRTLHRLREALGDDVLGVSADTIHLHPHADLWVDSAAFQDLVTAGLSSPSGDEEMPPERVAHLTAAVELYADDFLTGFTLPDSPAFDDWQFFERERLRQTLAQVLEWLLGTHQQQGAFEIAIAYARRKLLLDPLDEAIHRRLMQLYAWSGQQAAALRQYWECVRVLDDELGVPPDDETVALFTVIKAKRLRTPLALIQGTPRTEVLVQQDAREQSIPATAQQQAFQIAVPPQHALVEDGASPHPITAASAMDQQVRFCTAPDGVRIAYATVGTGPPLVKAANWLSHLEFDWNSPVWRHWLIGLSQHHTLVRYDRRGCGLSDWNTDDMSLEARVQDLETVVNVLNLDRFALLALSGSGPVAIAYAVRHPEKVSHLVLYGSYARGRLKRNVTPQQLEEVETLRQVMQIGWGKANPAFRQVYTTLFLPDGTPEQIHWLNELQRISTSPEVAVRIASADWSDDISELARQVAVPTLVLHPQDDAVVPFEEGRQLAALIPGAQFVPLESKNHILLESQPAWARFVAEVEHFVGVE